MVRVMVRVGVSGSLAGLVLVIYHFVYRLIDSCAMFLVVVLIVLAFHLYKFVTRKSRRYVSLL